MKKSRITALLTVCAMVGTMVFGIVPGVYAADAEPIRIEGESISTGTDDTLSRTDLNGGAAYKILQSTAKNSSYKPAYYTAQYTVTAPKAGLYSMKTVSSRQGMRYLSDRGDLWTSPYYIQVNDEAPFTFTEGSVYDKGILELNAGGSNRDFATYDGIPVYLQEGDNTVTFIVRDRMVGGDNVQFYMDYMEFTYQSSGAANLPVIVQGEEYADTNVPEAGRSEMTDSALNNGAALKISTAETIPADGFYVDYTATAAKEGMYTLEFSSSVQGYETADEGSNESCKAASPYTVKVNDGNAVSFNDFSGYRQSEKTVGDMKLVTYAMDVYLNRGLNTVRFVVKQGCVNDNTVIFALDYLKLSPLTHYSADDFKVEGESFSKANVSYQAGNACAKSDAGCSNGKKAYFYNTSEAPVLDYEFYVEKEGDYAIFAGSTYFNFEWAGKLGISVNGGDSIPVDETTSEIVSEIRADDHDLYKNIAVKEKLVHLTKGYNTMRLEGLSPRTHDNRHILAVDYIRFVRAEAGVSNNIDFPVKVVNMKWKHEKMTNGWRSEHYCEDVLADGKTASIEESFFVSEEGDYVLEMDAAGHFAKNHSWGSPAGISFDNEELVELELDKNVKYVAPIGADAAIFAHMRYMPTVHLTAGWHTLRFESMGAAEAAGLNGKTRVYWQEFTLEKAADVDTAALSFADPVITVGESTQAKITYLSAAGDKVTPEENAVSYTSSNTNVAEVDSDGKVTAFNPGKTVITACNDAVEIAGAELIVLPEGSTVFAQEVRRDNTNKTINVRVSSIGDMQADEEVSVIVASYATEEGLPTTLKSVSVNKVSGLKNGINQDIPVQIADLQASDTVNLYIWRSMGELVPLWTKDEVIVNN